MFEVMKTTALLQPTLLPAEEVLRIGTVNGARALFWDAQTGSIETGKKTDFAIVNLRKPHLCPIHDEVSHLVYSAKAAYVDTVLIDGKIVMEERELKTVDVEEIMEKAEETKENLLPRLRQEE